MLSRTFKTFIMVVLLGAMTTSGVVAIVCGTDELHNITCQCFQTGGDQNYYKYGSAVGLLYYAKNSVAYTATGFLIGDANDNYFLTTYLGNPTNITLDKVEFGVEQNEYAETQTGNGAKKYYMGGTGNPVANDPTLKYWLIKLNGYPIEEWGSLTLYDFLSVAEGDPVFLIEQSGVSKPQHHKQISSLRAPQPTVGDAGVPFFEHDADSKVYGAPVFNSFFEVIGMTVNEQVFFDCNSAVRMWSVLQDLLGQGIYIGTPVTSNLKGCPPASDPPNCCNCGTPSLDCDIRAEANSGMDLSLGGSPPVVLATLYTKTGTDLSFPGDHSFTLESDFISPAARRNTVHVGDTSVWIDVGNLEAHGHFDITNVFEAGTEPGQDLDRLLFKVTNVDGFAASLFADSLISYPPLSGMSTGDNVFWLDTTLNSGIVLSGSSGVVSVEGDLYLNFSNALFPPEDPAEVSVYIAGLYDFATGSLELTSIGWQSESAYGLGIIPTLSEWGLIAFVVILLSLITFYVVRRYKNTRMATSGLS